ncbi:hypothetical protein JCM19232_5151 [Vibrio ishigakensis]|uniref:histidine kinase n=1 Tax=Vibrio ishigakensis TaxID=1481914 RepID=A0A0B8PC73_9VIBR|nr:hypothetical protein JCM19232_5151 [Vibrio ishigakensis]
MNQIGNKLIRLWRRHSLWRLSLSVTLMLWLAVALALFSIYYLSIQPMVNSKQQLLIQHVQQLQQALETTPEDEIDLEFLTEDDAFAQQGVFTVIRRLSDNEYFGALNSIPSSIGHCPELSPFPVAGRGGIRLLEGCQHHGDNYQVLVATDNEYLWEIQENFAQAAIAVLICSFFIALIPSFLIRQRMKRHLSSIHLVVSQIEKGRFDGRIPLGGNDDEWDRISGFINSMLDEIESSVNQIQGVTDAIAHDLRTPLTRIRNRLSLLDTPSTGDSEQIQREFEDLINTFNAMLELSKLEIQSSAQFTQVDLAAIAEDAAELAEAQFEEKGQTLEVDIEPSEVTGERSLLFRVIYNLLDNAHKYCPENSTIKLHVANNKLVIEDDGPGIDPSLHSKVFQRLYRADTSRNSKGHGLGLSLVAVVAKLHDADIKLSYSDPAEKKGLKIEITF